MRKSLYQISQIARPNNSYVVINATIVDPKRLRFQAEVVYMQKDNQSIGHTIATPKGAVKTYSDFDAILKDVVAAFPSATMVEGKITITSLQKPTPPNYDADRANAAELSRTQRLALSQQKIVDDLNAELTKIAAFDTGTPSQKAIFAERKLQRDTALDSKTAMESRVTALLALV
jgi:hypothetical protein